MKIRIYHRSPILISILILIISVGFSYTRDNLPEPASMEKVKSNSGNPAIILEKSQDLEDWMIQPDSWKINSTVARSPYLPDNKYLQLLLKEDMENPIKLESWMLDGCDWCKKKRAG